MMDLDMTLPTMPEFRELLPEWKRKDRKAFGRQCLEHWSRNGEAMSRALAGYGVMKDPKTCRNYMNTESRVSNGDVRTIKRIIRYERARAQADNTLAEIAECEAYIDELKQARGL